MKRWSSSAQGYVVRPDVDAFLQAVIELSKAHGLSISHEDGHGAFLIEPYGDDASAWLNNAGLP